MRNSISEVIGENVANDLRSDFNEAICSGCSFGDIEDLFLDYGLELDYMEDMFDSIY